MSRDLVTIVTKNYDVRKVSDGFVDSVNRLDVLPNSTLHQKSPNEFYFKQLYDVQLIARDATTPKMATAP